MRTFELKNAIIREANPSYRTLKLKSKRYRLFLPYMIFVNRTDLGIMLFGMRATPFKNTQIKKQKVLFPPLPHVYANLICCSEATPEGYLSGNATASALWFGCALANKLLGGYAEWANKKPEEVMGIFENYPKQIDGYITANLWFYENTPSMHSTIPTQFLVSDMLGDLPFDCVSHAKNIGRAARRYYR